MSEEQAWSFTDWQCGTGIVDSCKNQKVNWDEPRSWQLIVDQLIPLAEFGIVFGMQYISSSIGPGTTKAMNSIRCMFNSGASSLWYIGAGGWLFIKYIGQADALISYLDEGYLYVCTCVYDLNGLKSMLGQSDESNYRFSICSEAAGKERIKANEEKRQYEEKQREAAAEALVNAAKNKKISDTVSAMKELDGCALRESSTLDDTKCFAAAQEFQSQSRMIETFWANMVWSTGGQESTKNKEEQTNFEESRWVMTGVSQGLKALYPDRYDDDGNLLQSCTAAGASTLTYGSACEQIIADYVSANSTPVAPCKDACSEVLKCYAGNDASGTEYTTDANCDLVQLQYGYSQWQDKASITCSDPATFSTLTGYDNCIDINGTWNARAAYINPDQALFRTIGETIGSVTEKDDGTKEYKEGSVRDEDIRCLGADFRTVRTGAANCWSYWIEGATLEIGVDTSKNPIKQDRFVWLTTEGIACGNDAAGNALTGPTDCKIATRTACNTSKLARLNIGSDSSSICIPTLTWESRSKTL